MITTRIATPEDVEALAGLDDRYSLNLLPPDSIANELAKPNVLIFLAEEAGDILGWMLCYLESDATGQYVNAERLTHRRRLEDGVDADGAPALGPRGAEVYVAVVSAAMRHYLGVGVNRTKFLVPDKMWLRLVKTYRDPIYGVKVGDAQDVFDGVQHHIDLRFGPSVRKRV